jgi:hypothetical protein
VGDGGGGWVERGRVLGEAWFRCGEAYICPHSFSVWDFTARIYSICSCALYLTLRLEPLPQELHKAERQLVSILQRDQLPVTRHRKIESSPFGAIASNLSINRVAGAPRQDRCVQNKTVLRTVFKVSPWGIKNNRIARQPSLIVFIG